MYRRLFLLLLLAFSTVPAAALTPPPEPPDHVETVYFDRDSVSVNSEAAARLARAAQAYAEARGRIIVTGHADGSESPEAAMALSYRMANAVRDHLVALGVEPQAIETRAFGSQRPAVAGSAGRREPLNRRVEVRACFHCNEEAAPETAAVSSPPAPAAATRRNVSGPTVSEIHGAIGAEPIDRVGGLQMQLRQGSRMVFRECGADERCEEAVLVGRLEAAGAERLIAFRAGAAACAARYGNSFEVWQAGPERTELMMWISLDDHTTSAMVGARRTQFEDCRRELNRSTSAS